MSSSFQHSTPTNILSMEAQLRSLAEGCTLQHAKQAINSALKIMNIIGRLESQSGCDELKMRILNVTTVAIASLDGKTPQDLPNDVKKSIERLISDLQAIEALLEATRAKVKKGFWQKLRANPKVKPAQLISQCSSKLSWALSTFNVESEIHSRINIGKISSMMEGNQTSIMTAIEQVNIGVERLTEAAASGLNDLPPPAIGLASPSTLELPSSTLPPRRDIFYGRDEYVDNIVDTLLSSEDGSRVAILGPGGMGKTSVALAIIHDPRLRKCYQDLCHWIPCDQATSPALLVKLIAHCLGISTKSHDPLSEIIRTLNTSPQHRLILFDNFETPWDLPEKQSQIESILIAISSVARLSILVTMRGVLPPSPSMRWKAPVLQPLSIEAARSTYLDICPDAEDDANLDTLLTAVDCVPLAVTLMATVGMSETTSPTLLLERWRTERTELLHLTDDRLKSVERSILISLSSSTIVANPESVVLLAILSMLPGGARRDRLKAIAPNLRNANSALGVLQRASLAYVNSATNYVRVLSPIRSYMLHHHPLDPSSRQHLHTAYYRLIQDVDCAGTPQFVEAKEKFHHEEVNAETILFDALESGDAQTAIQASKTYSWYLYMTIPRVDVLLAAMQKARTLDLKPSLADCLRCFGDILHMQGRCQEARENLTEARNIFLSSGMVEGEAQCLKSLGDIDRTQGRNDEARSFLQQAQQKFADIESGLGTAQCLKSIGDIDYMQGRYEDACVSFKEAKTQFLTIGSTHDAALCLKSLGNSARMVGNHDEARTNLQQALELFLSLGAGLGAARCLKGLGNMEGMVGNFDEARGYFRRATQQFKDIGSSIWEVRCIKGVANTDRLEGRLDEARIGFQEAQRRFLEIGSTLDAAQCLQRLGEIDLKQDRQRDARLIFEQARVYFVGVGSTLGQAQCLQAMGEIDVSLEHWDEAKSCLSDARSKYLDIGHAKEAAVCLEGLENVEKLQDVV